MRRPETLPYARAGTSASVARHGRFIWWGRVTMAVISTAVLAACSSGSDSKTKQTTSTAPPNTASVSGEPIDGLVGSVRDIRTPQQNARPQGIEDLNLGDCYDPAPNTTQQNVIVLLVPCDGPHRSEVFAQLEYSEPGLNADTDFVGADKVRNYAEERCFERFNTFVGIPWSQSDLNLETWYPTAASWLREHDRKITCVLQHRKKRDLLKTMANAKI